SPSSTSNPTKIPASRRRPVTRPAGSFHSPQHRANSASSSPQSELAAPSFSHRSAALTPASSRTSRRSQLRRPPSQLRRPPQPSFGCSASARANQAHHPRARSSATSSRRRSRPTLPRARLEAPSPVAPIPGDATTSSPPTAQPCSSGDSSSRSSHLCPRPTSPSRPQPGSRPYNLRTSTFEPDNSKFTASHQLFLAISRHRTRGC
ncbi:Unknown protein, partial [Striga hermonthica]